MSASPRLGATARSFRGLSDAELAELLAVAEPFELATGLLFRQGDPADSMYVLDDGEVEFLARTPGDELILLGRAGAGAVLGELSLIDDGVRSATARVAKPTSGWRLARHAFHMLRAARRPASVALLAHLSTLTCERVRARVADLGATLDRAPRAVFEIRGEVARERWTRVAAPALEPPASALLPFFRSLTGDERAALLASGSVHAVERGERLAVAGAPSDGTLVVMRGAALLSLEQGDRRERCGLAPPGRVVSVVASMDGGSAALDAAAREPSVVLWLEREVVARLRAANDGLAHKLEDAMVDELVRELRLVTGQLARLAAHGRAPLRG